MALGNKKKGWVFTTHTPPGAMGKPGAAAGLAGLGVAALAAPPVCCVSVCSPGKTGRQEAVEEMQKVLNAPCKPPPQIANLHVWPKCEIRGGGLGGRGGGTGKSFQAP